MLNQLDAKQRFMQKHKRTQTNEGAIVTLAILAIRKRADFDPLKRDGKALRKAIEGEFARLNPPRCWGKTRSLWLKEIVLNTVDQGTGEEWQKY